MMENVNPTSEIHPSAMFVSRLQEKEELQRLADKFSAYVGYIRQLGHHMGTVDTTSFVTGSKILDEEIANLKSIYEAELQKLRDDLEVEAREKSSLQTQCSNQQMYIGDLQHKLSLETDKNAKLLTEVSFLQRKLEGLESELHAAQSKLQSPDQVDRLERYVDNLTREMEQWKHRFEHEQQTSRELENRLQQSLKKAEFSDQVHEKEVQDYKNRLELAMATIVSLEGRLQDRNTIPISEVLKQVREKAEAELRSYQVESEEQFSKNLSVLKAQSDRDAETLQKLSQEKGELTEKIGELQDQIRNLEGQIASLTHQKKSLEDAMLAERRQADENIRHLEKKFKEAQGMLVMKMNEVISVRESSIPLKVEIETLKALMEEEEKRLQVPLSLLSASATQSNIPRADSKVKDLKTSFHETPKNEPVGSNRPTVAQGNLETFGGNRKVEEENKTHSSSSHLIVSVPAVTAAVPDAHASFVTTNYSSSFPYMSGSSYPYEPSPPLETFYIPQELQPEEDTPASNVNIDSDLPAGGVNMSEVVLPMTGPHYNYKVLYNQNSSDPTPPTSSRPVGPVHARTKSASENHKTKEAKDTENANNLKMNSLISEPTKISRPKSSPPDSLSSFQANDTGINCIGDLKIQEVSEDGRFVKLLNDGPTEYECSGYIIKQTVHGRPVAIFRFPSDTKFPPDSTITVWSAMNDPSVHNPPTDFFWKESQKWEFGPQCTTVLCRPNGQAVAWTIATHRFSTDAYMEAPGTKHDLDEENQDVNHSISSDITDNRTLTSLRANLTGPRPEPVFIRREKRHPPSLYVSKHPHGNNPSSLAHPHTSQARPHRLGNDNSTYSRQSRIQTVRPDPIPGLPYTGAPAQRLDSTTLRSTKSGRTMRPSGISENTTAGETSEAPSPFSRPWNRFDMGLKQICSQHNLDFLPPMPPPPQITW